jgi:hypothetical protein
MRELIFFQEQKHRVRSGCIGECGQRNEGDEEKNPFRHKGSLLSFTITG